MKQVKGLLQPVENGAGFGGKYYDAIQGDPGVAMLHGEVSKLF